MKKSRLGLGLLIAGCALAAPAAVRAAEQPIAVTATAEPYCSFGDDANVSGEINIVPDVEDTPTTVVHVANPVNAGGIMQDARFTFTIQSTCNAPSEFRLTTLNGGLANPAPPPVSGTWLNHINYSAHLTLPALGGQTSSLITDGTAGASSDLGTNGVAYSGQLQVSFDITQNTSAPLAGGTYSDTLTITVTPQ